MLLKIKFLFFVLAISSNVNCVPIGSEGKPSEAKATTIATVTEAEKVSEVTTTATPTTTITTPTTTEEIAETTPQSSSSSTTELAETSTSSAAPVSIAPIAPIVAIPSDNVSVPHRRVIKYDQRQDGKYNIRADLENIVVLMIPSSQSSSLSVLDLLTRSALKGKNAGKKHHQKHSDEYVRRPEVQIVDNAQSRVADHFIEGRSPYKVDISSARLRSDNDVGYLQPYPMINPSGRSTANRVVFPGSNQNQGNYFRLNSNNQLVMDNLSRDAKALSDGFYANNAAADNDEDDVKVVLSNSVGVSGDGSVVSGRSNNYDRSFTDDLIDSHNSFDSLIIPHIETIELEDDQLHPNPEWELKLIGAQEQCGPDRHRDSYGVCQFISN